MKVKASDPAVKTAVFLTAETLPVFRQRVGALAPDKRPIWGKRRPIEMIAHLRRNVEVALGEVQVQDGSNWVRRTVLRWYVFSSGIPWAKGKIHAPKVMSPAPEGDFAAECERFAETMERFVETLGREPRRRSVHPFFGPVKLGYWSRMLGMHIEYHLVQFDV